MKKITVIADTKIPFLKGVLDDVAKLKYLDGKEISNQEVQNTDALIIRTRTKCDKGLLQNSSLKFIASATIGFDHIDSNYCKANGIAWTNAPGCNAASVEQYVVAALLEIAHQFKFKLSEKTIGIIGVGHVGSKVAKAAVALGMKVLLNDPPRQRSENNTSFIDLIDLQKEADIISFHTPLNKFGKDKTEHLVNETFLNQLKAGVMLINTSRGEIIDEKDLIQAIDENKIKATVLDVWRNEPTINLDLLNKTFIATPHIAGYSADGKAKGTEMSVQALSKKFKLGLDDWKPTDIPHPENPIIEIDCSNKTTQEIIYEAYKQSYAIQIDDANLKQSPKLFEDLRGYYPNRREAKAYTISFGNHSNAKVTAILENLGFNCID